MKIHPSLTLSETINIHLTRSCNFGCRFCYAGFAECGAVRLTTAQVNQIIVLASEVAPLTNGGRRKVNFAGGEPFLHPGLIEIIRFTKRLGLKTSVVTNGSLLTERTIAELSGALEICALSVDSSSIKTNEAIGRCSTTFRPEAGYYRNLANQVRAGGMRLKINTVVNRLNLSENLGELVATLAPFRWKLFQVKKVIAQNDHGFDGFAISAAEFDDFVARNRRLLPDSIAVIPETAEDMTASYAMIAPNGCFFDCVHDVYRYSRPITEVGIIEAFRDVAFSEEKFMLRGGRYE